MFTSALNRERLYQQIADKILEFVVEKRLKPGDRLPAERELATVMKVSRTVIREAVRVLGARGVLEVRPGAGTFVAAPTTEEASSAIGLLLRRRDERDSVAMLHEVRRTLEVELAGLAAERASEEDVLAMARAIEGMDAAADDAEEFVEHDLAFHSALAGATHNDLFSLLLSPITDLLLEFRLVAYEHDRPGAVRGGLRHHRRILECIRTHNADGARQAMREHLDHGLQVYLKVRPPDNS